ncbi:unnamed protein product [Adineta ricciae]|uniref:N-acetyltransferase domain-containing protein n=1 Tax=Adineta ricciae TaxID=249248 RepID=A0A813WZ70_ADIRI|nr:unnamed protein product [Adineta ricciae]CAF1070254.1 unnamed protein product [Adineta ricciae]
MFFSDPMPPPMDSEKTYELSIVYDNDLNQYLIRPLTLDDLETVIKIDQDTWQKLAWPIDTFHNALNDPRAYSWVLETTTIDHSIVGYGMQIVSGSNSNVTNLTLHPSQCGRGLGGLILRHMIEHARQLAMLSMTLEVDTSNIRAYNLYTKHGFAITHFLENYYENQTDAYEMKLIL